MTMKTYKITDAAPRELRRRANANGEITMSESAAKYELSRKTLIDPSVVQAKAPAPKASGKSAATPTPVLANGGN